MAKNCKTGRSLSIPGLWELRVLGECCVCMPWFFFFENSEVDFEIYIKKWARSVFC